MTSNLGTRDIAKGATLGFTARPDAKVDYEGSRGKIMDELKCQASAGQPRAAPPARGSTAGCGHQSSPRWTDRSSRREVMVSEPPDRGGTGVGASADCPAPPAGPAAWAVLEHLVRKGFVEQLPAQVARFCGIGPADADEVAAFALDQLCREAERGRPIPSPAAYAWKTAVRQGKRVHDRLPRFATDKEVADTWLAGVQDDPEDDQNRETLRLVRALIPRISQEKPRLAMELVFDAWEDGRTHLPPAEVAEALGINVRYGYEVLRRGYQALRRLAREEGLDIALEEPAEPEEPEDEDEEATK